MWTNDNRARYDRSKLRYPSDLTDDEWRLIKPLIPRAKRGGIKHTVVIRDVVDGLMYVLSTGCQWRVIPKDLAAAQHGQSLLRVMDLRWDGALVHEGSTKTRRARPGGCYAMRHITTAEHMLRFAGLRPQATPEDVDHLITE